MTKSGIEMEELRASKEFAVRFSEVDSMNVVWHGSYPLYFEDAREAFGKKYGLEYTGFFDHGYFAPLVDLSFHYKKPVRYGMRPRIDILYRPTEAAKIVFDYEIHDLDYQLVWDNPPFYQQWKERWGQVKTKE